MEHESLTARASCDAQDAGRRGPSTGEAPGYPRITPTPSPGSAPPLGNRHDCSRPRCAEGLPPWALASGHDPRALALVDGLGRFAEHGPHYSRRSPGSRSFTGCGAEVVLVTEDGCAVWACVYQRTPVARGMGGSRGRGAPDARPRWLWRNMLFRNLGPFLSSALIVSATAATYVHWAAKYGELPPERLRTEIGVREVRSSNPGYCYLQAGWEPDRYARGKRYLFAPRRTP